jgi:methylamine dehydrogenase light chain
MSKFKPDQVGERWMRRLASFTSRRGFLSRLGAVVVTATTLPLLPVSRAFAAKPDRTVQSKTGFARSAQSKDDTQCNYWRYCAIDGFLCSCCGGGVHTCPPGTKPSPTSWVGSCTNPDDSKAYLISYRDCCGTAACGQCICENTDRETQSYRPQGNNEIIWCFGLSTMEYHCSTAVLVGEAQ